WERKEKRKEKGQRNADRRVDPGYSKRDQVKNGAKYILAIDSLHRTGIDMPTEQPIMIGGIAPEEIEKAGQEKEDAAVENHCGVLIRVIDILCKQSSGNRNKDNG